MATPLEGGISCASIVLPSTFDSLSVVILSIEGQEHLIVFLLNTSGRVVNRKTINSIGS